MAENRELALVLKLVADEFQKELRNSQGHLASFNNFIKDWRTQLAAAGTALFAVAKSTANFGEEALKGAQRAGTTVEAYTALQHAAKMADIESQQLTVGLKGLSQTIVEAARGSGEGAKLFAAMGLSSTTAKGQIKPTVEVLLELADVFQKMPDGAEKFDAAQKIFGKSSSELIPFLNQGKAGIVDLMKEAERLGVVMSKDSALAADQFNNEMKRLQASMQGLQLELGKQLIPALLEFMETVKSITSTGGVQFFFKGLAEQTVLFSTLIKEAAANVEFLFGKFTFEQLKTEIKRLEAEASAKLLLLENPEAAKFVNGPPKEAQTGRDVSLSVSKPALVDQEKLGKAKLEIFLAQNRALEIQARLARESAAWANEFFLAFDRQQQFKQEDEAEQKRRGQAIVQQTQLEVQIREAAQQRERDGLVQNAQAWIDYDNQVGASTELRYQHQLDLLHANLANQLQITKDEAAKLVQAWDDVESEIADTILSQTRLTAQERETIELQSLTKLAAINQQHSGNIFQGWAIGLQRYLQDTQSAFGFAADMARRGAQFMEQNFRQFFFDVMDERIKSLKDLFRSFGNFMKQIIAQVMAQLATMVVVKGLTGGFGSFGLGGLGGMLSGIFQGGGFGAAKFAGGGPVLGAGNQDTVRALLTPGEGVLNQRGMQALAQLNNGAAPNVGDTNITVNMVNAGRTDQPQVNFRRQFKGMVMDIIWTDPDFRNMLGGRA